MRFDHTVAVLRFEKKGFALTRKSVLQGLSEESADTLKELGNDGWELVAVIPYSVGGSGIMTSNPATDSALAFFKRPIA